MSKKENFKRELRKFRRRWFPTTTEKAERKAFTSNLLRCGANAEFYYTQLKKG